MKTRQEQEALEEFIEKQRRLEDYRLRCIKDEERAEHRRELYRRIGPFDPINVTEDGGVVSGHLVKRNDDGSQVLFFDKRGRRKSKGEPTALANRSKSAEVQCVGREKGLDRSNLGERSSSLEGKKRPLSTLNSQNSKKQEGSKESVPEASKRPVASNRDERKLSNTSQYGSKEKLPNNRFGSRECFKSFTDLNRSGSKEKLSDVTKQPSLGGDHSTGNSSNVKPEWNSSEKIEYTKPSKQEAETTSTGKTKKPVTVARSSSLEKEKKNEKQPTDGDDRRWSVASLYVYRGSVSSECDDPLTYSRSRSKLDDDEDGCEDDLVQSLLATDEGRAALEDGRPLSREGRKRLHDGVGGIGNNSQTPASQLMAEKPTEMKTKQGQGDSGESKGKPVTIKPDTKGKTTTDKGSNKDPETEVTKLRQVKQRGKDLIEEEPLMMALQEGDLESSLAMNFDAEQEEKSQKENKSVGQNEQKPSGSILKGLSFRLFFPIHFL